MAKGKTIALYVTVGVASFFVITGLAIRNWLKMKVTEAGSPSAFASQMALSSLERRVSGRMGEALSPEQRDKIQQAILQLRGQSSRFDQGKTVALFTIISDFEQQVKREHGQPSPESVKLLVANLQTLCSMQNSGEPPKP